MSGHHKTPQGFPRDKPSSATVLDRRSALKAFFGGAAAALASCGRPPEEVVPYVQIPKRLTPGVPLKFASALPLGGYGRGVMVTSVEGRPIKIEGNPHHPASLGATDVYGEATVLSLYDPDRSQAPYSSDRIQSWSSFEMAFRPRIDQARQRQGAGLALLTGRVTSPTLVEQIEALIKSMPQARWYRYEPVEDDAVRNGAMLAFGRAVTALPRFADARVMLALDADPIGFGAEQIRFGREIIEGRRSRVPEDSLRIYAVEPAWTLIGALADHRLALQPQLICNVAIEIARALGAGLNAATLPSEANQFVQTVAADLLARRGRALVTVGPRQPAEAHALCHWINGQLQAPVDFIAPVDPVSTGHAESLRNLATEVRAGHVETMVIIGANPAYDTPGDLAFGDIVAAVPFTAQLASYRDETAQRCTWHLPLTHVLESWSDIRAFDGTASIIQPLIRPLYDSRDPHQMLAMLTGGPVPSTRDIVRSHWRAAHKADGNWEDWWRQTLQDGVIADTASQKISPPAVKLPQIAPAAAVENFTLVLSPDPSVFDGSMANNAWLQECAKPFTKQVWGNALHLSEVDAHELGVVDGDMVRIELGQLALEAGIFVQPGQAPRVVAATLGYGRMHAGSIGSGVGFDLYRLRSTNTPWLAANVSVARTGNRENLLHTQHFFVLEGEAEDLQPRLTLADLAEGASHLNRPDANPPTLYPAQHYDTYQWAMAIDASACIGCNACVVACQAENNVPVVGPEEIAEGRDMHWLRVDEYVVDGRPGFTPTPCMHCEHAPCEPVCPVAASIHDSEGLNVQVYNRCIGTRFCQSNCPYKVRRFNFFGYADGEEYANLGADIAKAVFNPDVTVRNRGVMEKCTYCVQRISAARRAAEKEGRSIREGDVVTACQAACPTQAISFGDLSDPKANIHSLRGEARSYALLGNLGTRPRTTYLARLQNPNPDFGKVRS